MDVKSKTIGRAEDLAGREKVEFLLLWAAGVQQRMAGAGRPVASIPSPLGRLMDEASGRGGYRDAPARLHSLTPSQHELDMADEIFQWLLLVSDLSRRVVVAKLKGASYRAIGNMVGKGKDTIQRRYIEALDLIHRRNAGRVGDLKEALDS